jgi:hypothetical protein
MAEAAIASPALIGVARLSVYNLSSVNGFKRCPDGISHSALEQWVPIQSREAGAASHHRARPASRAFRRRRPPIFKDRIAAHHRTA